MPQPALSTEQPHNNRNLYSDHYLDIILKEDPRWEAALPEAAAFRDWLKTLYAKEKNQLSH